jgi:hypothetical protein
MVVPVGTMGSMGTMGTVVLWTGTTVYYGTTNGYYVVPKTGYYRVLQAYAAEEMSRVSVGLGLTVCTLYTVFNVSKSSSNKNGEGFRRGRNNFSIKIGLERCGLKEIQ